MTMTSSPRPVASDSEDSSNRYSDPFDEDGEDGSLDQAIQIQAIMQSPASSISSERVDYINTLGSSGAARLERERSVTWATGCLLADVSNRNDLQHGRGIHFSDVAGESVLRAYAEDDRRKTNEKLAIDVIVAHLSMLCFTHTLVQVLLLFFRTLYISDEVLFQTELGIVFAFPPICLLALWLLEKLCEYSGARIVLLAIYSIAFALFLFSSGDLVFGAAPTRCHAAVMLFMLTVSLFIFSMFFVRTSSVHQQYCRLALITFAVSLAIGMLLTLTQSHLPECLKRLFQPDLFSSNISGVWSTYAMVVVLAFASMVLASIIQFTLHRKFNQALRPRAALCAIEGERDKTINVALLSLRTLVSVELFFLVLPYDAIKRLIAKFRTHSYISIDS